MPLTQQDLLSHLVELIDYRVKEVSYVDEGANLLPFLLTKNLKGADVKKEAFEALLQTKVKNADEVINVLKKANVPEEDRPAVESVLKVLTGLKKAKSLSNKTLGDALAAAELAEMAGNSTGTQDEVRGAFDFIANKVAVKITKMLEEGEEHKKTKDDDEEEDAAEAAARAVADREKKDGDEDEDDEEETSAEAEEINKRRGGKSMVLDDIPVDKNGNLDIKALKKAKVDDGVITLVKSLWSQNKNLVSTVDSLNNNLNKEVELRIDKKYEAEAAPFESLKFEGLKDTLKSFGESNPEEYPKLKSLLQVVADKMKAPEHQDFSPMGGSSGGQNTGDNPNAFYQVCKSKAAAAFKDDNMTDALAKYWKTPEGKADYVKYDNLVTNR